MGCDYLTPQLINHVVFSSATPPRLTNTVNPVLIIQLAVCLSGRPLTLPVSLLSTSPCSVRCSDKQDNEVLLYNTAAFKVMQHYTKGDVQTGRNSPTLWQEGCWIYRLFYHNLQGNAWSPSSSTLLPFWFLKYPLAMSQCFSFNIDCSQDTAGCDYRSHRAKQCFPSSGPVPQYLHTSNYRFLPIKALHLG